MMKFFKVSVLFLLLIGMALQFPMQAHAETATNSTYQIILGDDDHINQLSTLYFPSKNPQPGRYDHPGDNSSSSMVTYPYPIRVWWHLSISGCSGTLKDNPWFRISLVNPKGEIITSNLINKPGCDQNCGDSFILPANTGMVIQGMAGYWTYYHGGLHWPRPSTDHNGFSIEYSVSYQPDMVAPGAPGQPNVPQAELSGDTYHIDLDKQNTLPLTWSAATDSGTTFNGVTTTSGIGSYANDPNAYTIYIDGKPQDASSIGFQWDASENHCNGTIKISKLLTTLPNLLAKPFTLAVRAKDLAGNLGQAGQTVKIAFDDQITVDAGQWDNIIVAWPKIEDGLRYQVKISQSSAQPDTSVVESELCQVPYQTYKDFAGEKFTAQKIYYAWVRVVDSQNNPWPWVSGKFSPNPEKATFTAESISGMGTDGKPMYKVGLALSHADAVAYKILRQVSGDSSTLKELENVPYADMAKKGFQYEDAAGLVKHQIYQYSIVTTNILGQESGSSQTVEAEIANISPAECTVTAYPRPLEVQNEVTFQLGPMADPEGDRLTYRLYRRVPGVGEGELIESWQPTVDNQVLRTGQFGDQSSYEWQIRCVETGIAQAKEVIHTNWQLLQVDTNGIIIICHNDCGINNWGTKKQPLQFSVEINSGKTFTDYRWDFGDGNTSNGSTATHTYTAMTPPQTPYSVTVTAVDASQTKRNGSGQIRIVNTPKGKLYDSETWSGIHSMDGEVIVPSGLTLTIASGTQIQVNPNGAIKADGKLEAVGGSQNIQIDSQDGSSLWKGIRFEENGSGILTGVTIGHAEQGIYADGSCTVNLSDVTLQNCNTGLEYSAGMVKATGCKFLNNNNYGVKDNNDDNPYPALSNCLFKGNYKHYADSAGLEYSKEDVNAFQYNGNDNIFQ